MLFLGKVTMPKVLKPQNTALLPVNCVPGDGFNNFDAIETINSLDSYMSFYKMDGQVVSITELLNATEFYYNKAS